MVCQPSAAETMVALTRRWAEDRALLAGPRERLAMLVRAAMSHGLRFDPRRVTLLIRWLDRDRVRMDLRWLGGSDTAQPSPEFDDVRATISTLDTFADEWGVGRKESGWVQWMVVDTR